MDRHAGEPGRQVLGAGLGPEGDEALRDREKQVACVGPSGVDVMQHAPRHFPALRVRQVEPEAVDPGVERKVGELVHQLAALGRHAVGRHIDRANLDHELARGRLVPDAKVGRGREAQGPGVAARGHGHRVG
jgi:hypothetical protein